MTLTPLSARRRARAAALAAVAILGTGIFCGPAAAQAAKAPPRGGGDFIVAVVNSELVTAFEVEQRLLRAREEAQRRNAPVPPEAELRRQVVDGLIEERVVVTYARESGVRVDDPELDRAVASVAAQNRLTPDQLRERLRAEGLDYARFRANLRDQILAERVREREVVGRIDVTDAEVDRLLAQQKAATATSAQINVAQILVSVRDGADADELARRRARADEAIARLKAGEDFALVALQMSDDSGTREKGGEFGLRPIDRLPTLFVDAVRPLTEGAVTPTPVKSGAGFHVLKLVARQQETAYKVTQTRARHVLLRPSAQLTVETATQRLAEAKRQIESGSRPFDAVARAMSEDGSAQQGGDLGWVSPGSLVPEFEEAMNRLSPGGISDPVVSRFGVHLIQVVERRQADVDRQQLREQARNSLREQKFEGAYQEWVRDLRDRAYVEMREPPQ
jgi:peptidyl-prolyl cis-trans isomerase SurA